jgi:hypothetical protein
MKEAKKALYQNAVIPELIKIKEELNRWLAPMYGNKLCIEFDFTVIPELQEEADKVVDQLSKAWWITPNEKREVMNYGVDEDDETLNDYFIPANLIPVNPEQMDAPIEPIDIDVNKFLSKAEIKTEVKENKLQLKDLFSTKNDAELRAIEMGGNGSHQIGGYYMPFNSNSEYIKAKK